MTYIYGVTYINGVTYVRACPRLPERRDVRVGVGPHLVGVGVRVRLSVRVGVRVGVRVLRVRVAARQGR